MKVFVVMEIGWEYNDENYYRPESEGGTPKVAYAKKADALNACAEMNTRKLDLPRSGDMVTGYRDEDDFDVIEEYYEVKEVELVGE